MEAGNNAIINNLSGASFDVQSSAGIRGNSPYIGGSATFNNQGTLTKSTGSGTSISAVLNNTGTVSAVGNTKFNRWRYGQGFLCSR